jgi:hypothetical protein
LRESPNTPELPHSSLPLNSPNCSSTSPNPSTPLNPQPPQLSNPLNSPDPLNVPPPQLPNCSSIPPNLPRTKLLASLLCILAQVYDPVNLAEDEETPNNETVSTSLMWGQNIPVIVPSIHKCVCVCVCGVGWGWGGLPLIY